MLRLTDVQLLAIDKITLINFIIVIVASNSNIVIIAIFIINNIVIIRFAISIN